MVKKAVSKKKVSLKNKKKVKRKVKKSVSKKGKTTKITYQSTKVIKVEKALIDNFIGLQKVMVNLSSKFDNLANQISKLLELFEISARSLAKKDFGIEKDTKESEKILEKLDKISEHAGLIGKGLALIHEAGQGLSPPPQGEIAGPRETNKIPQIKRPPLAPTTPRMPPGKIQGEEYQKSMNPQLQKRARTSEEEDAKTDF